MSDAGSTNVHSHQFVMGVSSQRLHLQCWVFFPLMFVVSSRLRSPTQLAESDGCPESEYFIIAVTVVAFKPTLTYSSFSS